MKENDKNGDYFIELVSSYINNKPIRYDKTINVKTLINLFDIHQLIGVFACINKDNIFNLDYGTLKWVNDRLSLEIYNSVKLNKLYDDTSKLLAQNNVPNIVVKGIVLKKYYPDPDLRTMSDVDIVVNEKYIKNGIEILKENGYVLCESGIDEYKFKKNAGYLELHEDLTSDDLKNGIDYKKKMQYIFENVVKKKHNIYELLPECHLVYLVLHIAHHLFCSGCGIRQIVDVALIMKNEKINMTAVNEKLRELKLEKLGNAIFFLCDNWFDIKCNAEVISHALYSELYNYIIYGGVFGANGNRENNAILREGYYGNFFVTNMRRVFPNARIMERKIPWFMGKPKILLPIAWLCFWWKLFKNNPNKIKKHFKDIFKPNKEAEDELQMLKELGFYK